MFAVGNRVWALFLQSCAAHFVSNFTQLIIIIFILCEIDSLMTIMMTEHSMRFLPSSFNGFMVPNIFTFFDFGKTVAN